MIDEKEHSRFGDSNILEPIVEQQDDEISFPSSINKRNFDRNEEQKRAQKEIEDFEALEKEFASNRHGIRVKFANDDNEETNSNDDQSITQTTVIKTEPYFHVQSTEDQTTKHFYENSFPINEQIQHKTARTPDSLEEEDLGEEEKQFYRKENKYSKNRIYPTRRSRSPSPRPKMSSSESNEFPDLVELTNRGNYLSQSLPVRSLFEPTINIFDSRYNHRQRPSRLRYYIKPYRGDANQPQDLKSHQRSRSLSEQRSAAQHWFSFANENAKPIHRKQHISWSPVREYIHQGRQTHQNNNKKKKDKSDIPLTNRSSSNPCLPSSSNSRTSKIPIYCEINRPSNFVTEEEKPNENKREHHQTMERYDRLLEKMRTTDEQLQLLSKSWNNKTPIKSFNKNSSSNTISERFVSPMTLQTCLIVLLIFNLLVVYFFNDIHLWWSKYSGYSKLMEQSQGQTSNFS